MNEKGKLIVLSGPSGAGKSTVLARMMNYRKDVCFSVSVTTRAPRPGETDGKDYFFIDHERFEEMVRDGELLEHAEYVGNCYGTPKAYVDKKLTEGMNVVLDIEVQGAEQVHEKMPEAVMVFLSPPSLKDLRERLEKRGTETAETIEARVLRAAQEYDEADFYDWLVINDDVERAADELSSIITASRCTFCERKTVLDYKI